MNLLEQPCLPLPLALNQHLMAPGTMLGTQKECLMCYQKLKSVGNGSSSQIFIRNDTEN